MNFTIHPLEHGRNNTSEQKNYLCPHIKPEKNGKKAQISPQNKKQSPATHFTTKISKFHISRCSSHKTDKIIHKNGSCMFNDVISTVTVSEAKQKVILIIQSRMVISPEPGILLEIIPSDLILTAALLIVRSEISYTTI